MSTSYVNLKAQLSISLSVVYPLTLENPHVKSAFGTALARLALDMRIL